MPKQAKSKNGESGKSVNKARKNASGGKNARNGASKNAGSSKSKSVNNSTFKNSVKGTEKKQTKFWSVKTWPLWGKVLGGILAVLLLAVIFVILRYTTAFNSFLDKITDWGKETKEYSVIVLSQSEVSDVKELDQKTTGFLRTDPNAGSAAEYLKAFVNINDYYYDNIGTLASVLNTRIAEAIVLETSRFEGLKEEAEDSVKDMRVIYTFTIELTDDNVEKTEKDLTSEPSMIYISGSDSRNGVKATARSDVNIIAVINPAQGKILLVSIPRDTYVQLHGTTGLRDKLSHAGIYGIGMSKDTIEDLLDINIDHTIKVSFDSVIQLVDQIDGIEVDSDKAMHLKAEGKDKICDYVVGKQWVDGDCALRFARERKSYNTGDRHRGANQQQVITSVIGKLSQSKNYLLKMPTILDIAADSFETDLSRDQIMAFLGLQLDKKINWQVESIALDGDGVMEPTYSMGPDLPLYVMIPNDESMQNIKNKISQYLSE